MGRFLLKSEQQQPREEPENEAMEPQERPISERLEQSADERLEQPTDEPREQPADQPREQPAGALREQPVDEPQQQPVDEPQERLAVELEDDFLVREEARRQRYLRNHQPLCPCDVPPPPPPPIRGGPRARRSRPFGRYYPRGVVPQAIGAEDVLGNMLNLFVLPDEEEIIVLRACTCHERILTPPASDDEVNYLEQQDDIVVISDDSSDESLEDQQPSNNDRPNIVFEINTARPANEIAAPSVSGRPMARAPSSPKTRSPLSVHPPHSAPAECDRKMSESLSTYSDTTVTASEDEDMPIEDMPIEEMPIAEGSRSGRLGCDQRLMVSIVNEPRGPPEPLEPPDDRRLLWPAARSNAGQRANPVVGGPENVGPRQEPSGTAASVRLAGPHVREPILSARAVAANGAGSGAAGERRTPRRRRRVRRRSRANRAPIVRDRGRLSPSSSSDDESGDLLKNTVRLRFRRKTVTAEGNSSRENPVSGVRQRGSPAREAAALQQPAMEEEAARGEHAEPESESVGDAPRSSSAMPQPEKRRRNRSRSPLRTPQQQQQLQQPPK